MIFFSYCKLVESVIGYSNNNDNSTEKHPFGIVEGSIGCLALMVSQQFKINYFCVIGQNAPTLRLSVMMGGSGLSC